MSKYLLSSIEFDITNKCNLNCAGCCHFSNLTTKETLYDLDEFEKDIIRLNNLFIIKKFKIVGGEPFLVDNIIDYVKVIIKYFTNSRIEIYTNNTLRNKIQNFLIKCKELNYNNIKIRISEYPLIASNTNNDTNIYYTNKEKFKLVNLNLKGNSNPEIAHSFCFTSSAWSLFKGKIYICPIAKNINTFIEKFKLEHIDLENAYIDIYKNTATDILDYLYNFDKGLSYCRYCKYEHPTIKWKISNNTVSEYISEEVNHE